ncbi:MAG: hypothetical protein V7704_19905 [Aurantimonas endophytica]|jgi:hypothetical protein|uniref:Uncharacterized protein n=1 Tax=Aurantimonas endophytica TaxID=1522175 RepID=A0A7W6HCH8_9HYPH|nr:hypothetical protein [Aurantimonas endophytica]MBB4002532.1 hypothetical protein [Aurantimonas endophytica]MCO6403413.1 hypothetical protein [Aurantimonas endophytica]
MSTVANIDMQTNLGSLIGRPDLSDEVIASALCERLRAEGRSDSDADDILTSARHSQSEAASLLRTIAVPAPSATLTMPTQQLTSARRRFSLGAGFAKLSLGR